MTRGRGPTGGARTVILQLVLVAVVIVAVFLFLTSGGPSFVGRIWAELIGAP